MTKMSYWDVGRRHRKSSDSTTSLQSSLQSHHRDAPWSRRRQQWWGGAGGVQCWRYPAKLNLFVLIYSSVQRGLQEYLTLCEGQEKRVAKGPTPELTPNLKQGNLRHQPCSPSTSSQSSHFAVSRATSPVTSHIHLLSLK